MEHTVTRTTSRAFAIGLFGNTALAILKLAVGWLSGSLALTADGWHSLSDVVTNAGAWIAHVIGKRPPDEDHHYGHGNAEAVAGVLIGATLVTGGAAVAASGMFSETELRPEAHVLALSVALISVAANLGLAWITTHSARTARSQSLMALARDNLSDALSGLLVVIAIVLARFGMSWAEPLTAVMIGALIVFLGFRSLVDGLHVLMDRAPDLDLRGRLTETAEEVSGVRGVQTVRVHPLGDHVRVDLEISVDGTLTVDEGHRIAHAVEEALRRSHDDIGGVHVHVNPHSSP